MNGKVVTEMGVKVDPDNDKVEVDEVQMSQDRPLFYLALNKPKGYVCSMKATRQDPKIVTDLIDMDDLIIACGGGKLDTASGDAYLAFAL